MKRIICIILCLILTAGILLTGCSFIYGPTELNVAIYPYIPNQELFREILTQRWAQIEPNVTLNYVNWDCYFEDPPVDIDIIMYDALFMQQIVADGYVQPITKKDIENPEGLLPFALDGAVCDEEYYGIPFLVCSNFLIYYKEDTEVAAAESFEELYTLVMPQFSDDANKGISANYYDSFPYFYLDASIDHTGVYSQYEEIPAFDPAILDSFYHFENLVTPAPADDEMRDSLGTFYRAYLFNQGFGRFHYGYSEDMALMTDIQEKIAIKGVSLADSDDIPMFFADIVSMTPQVESQREKKLCKKLMNLVASEDFLREVCFGTEQPQYMLPTRMSLYSLAAEKYPIYTQLGELVMNENNRLYRFGPDVHEYLTIAYSLTD